MQRGPSGPLSLFWDKDEDGAWIVAQGRHFKPLPITKAAKSKSAGVCRAASRQLRHETVGRCG